MCRRSTGVCWNGRTAEGALSFLWTRLPGCLKSQTTRRSSILRYELWSKCWSLFLHSLPMYGAQAETVSNSIGWHIATLLCVLNFVFACSPDQTIILSIPPTAYSHARRSCIMGNVLHPSKNYYTISEKCTKSGMTQNFNRCSVPYCSQPTLSFLNPLSLSKHKFVVIAESVDPLTLWPAHDKWSIALLTLDIIFPFKGCILSNLAHLSITNESENLEI